MHTIKLEKDGVEIGCLPLLNSLTTSGLPMTLMLIGGIPCLSFQGIMLIGITLGFLAFAFIIDSL